MTDSEPKPDHSRTARCRTSRRRPVHAKNAIGPLQDVPALDPPARESAPLPVSHQPVADASSRGFKALLEAAPLDGIDLERPRDLGRVALSRTGFMTGRLTAPDDFDWLVEGDIADQFETKE